MVSALLVVCVMPAAANSAAPARAAAAGNSAYTTTLNYVIRYYPRYISWFIQQYIGNSGGHNRFTVPETPPSSGLTSPNFRLINAINVDTTYGGCMDMDLSQGPQILTMPAYAHVASLLTLNVFGQVFNTGIVPGVAGTYALALPSWHGTLPPGVKRVDVPVAQSEWFIRADRYTNSGVNVIRDSKAFVHAVRLTSLAAYEANPSSGRAVPVPPIVLRPSANLTSTQAMLHSPSRYLFTLQEAVHSPSTGPLTASDRALSRAFDSVFATAQRGVERGRNGEMSQVVEAVRTAHTMIYNHYYSHLIPGSEWINFTNAANSGTSYLDNDAFQSFVLYGNSNATTRYFDTFTDHLGTPLDTNNFSFYRLTIPKADIPDAKRFWSLTAYIPPIPALMPRPINGNNGQGNVASYTPGLQRNRDGSITVYIQPNRPRIASRRPNWLPVPQDGPFSIVLRVYGPTGNTAAGTTYIPPEIKPLGIL